MKYTQSSRRTPCPICGRSKNGYCRFNEELVYCYHGVSHGPPTGIKIGDVVTGYDGVHWAFVGDKKGFSGNSALFKVHQPLERCSVVQRINPKAVKQIDDLHNLEADLNAFDQLALKALSIPPLETLLDEDIFTARNACSEAYKRSLGLIKRLTRIKRRDASYEHVLDAVLVTQRQLYYQLQDLDSYCANPAKYWEKHLLHRSSWDWIQDTPEAAEPESDWAFWNRPDPTYKPTHPIVRQMYYGHGGDQ